MSSVTLLEEIDELERRIAVARLGGPLLAVADDEEDEDDLFGEDDLGFDDIDEEDPDDVDGEGDHDEDEDSNDDDA
ncbi:MAG TPA: hypothetical protein VKS25_09180 [Solirubrobacteraceae bacterium]|nr:hypothetical protein [Solirubrobacteraceae bacterium]